MTDEGALGGLPTVVQGRVARWRHNLRSPSEPSADLVAPQKGREIGGLGIHLARGTIDDLDYSREKGQNRLHMTKRIRPDGRQEQRQASYGASRPYRRRFGIHAEHREADHRR